MKKALIMLLVISGCFVFASQALALELDWPNSPLGTPFNESSQLTDLVRYFYEWAVSLGGLAVFVVLILAGFQYLTSAGNPEKMRDAMDRIKSAVFGLILLLGSVLILNIINPQLTYVEIPSFPPGDILEGLSLDIPTGPSGEPCSSVTLCATVLSGGDNPTCSNIIANIGPQGRDGPTVDGMDPKNKPIKSILFKGDCLLTLYRLAGFESNGDNPILTIYGTVKDFNNYGEIEFKSAKVTDVSQSQ